MSLLSSADQQVQTMVTNPTYLWWQIVLELKKRGHRSLLFKFDEWTTSTILNTWSMSLKRWPWVTTYCHMNARCSKHQWHWNHCDYRLDLRIEALMRARPLHRWAQEFLRSERQDHCLVDGWVIKLRLVETKRSESLSTNQKSIQSQGRERAQCRQAQRGSNALYLTIKSS